MSSALLQTKLYVPATRPDLVVRPHLLARLNQGMHDPTRVILVSAPAGFGKTTLVSAWLAQLDRQATLAPHVGWLSLGEDDNDPVQFLHYVVAALQTAMPDVGRHTLAVAQSSPPPPLDKLTITLLNELATLSHPILLVLDDYHALTTLAIHETVNFLIDHMPPMLRLVIVTREDPPLALSRLRVRQQLTEIRAADLRFTEDEAREFLNQVMALELTPGDVATLEACTEGWIAGLQLAALSLRSTTDRAGFIQTFAGSHRFLTDYLVDEVLSRQPAGIQTFLQRTSILERFCADVCDALLAHEESREILRQLEQTNLFLISLDNQRHWYRYHHLFAEFLRARLYEHEPDFVPDLYHRAIDWFEQNDLPREALHYALKARDYERAADLIEVLAPEVLVQDHHMLIVQWADALPPALVQQRAYLCAYLGWAWSITGEMETASTWLDRAETLSTQLDPDQARVIQGHVATHRAYIVMLRGKHTHGIPLAHRALELLPAHETALRTRAMTSLGTAYIYAGQLQEAKQTSQQAIDIAQSLGSLPLAMFGYSALGSAFKDGGDLEQARNVYQQLLDLSEDLTGSPDGPLTGYAYIELGVIWREQHELDQAIEQLNKGVRLCREWQQGEALAVGLLECVETHRLRGEYAQAEAFLAEVRTLAAAMSPWAIQLVDAFAARVALSQGDMATVAHWAAHSGLEKATDHAAACDTGYARISECPALIRLYLATGRAKQALDITDYLCQRERVSGRMRRWLIFLILHAAALDTLGEHERALRALTEAVEHAAPHNNARPFVDHARTLLPYLRRLPPTPFRDRLLSLMDVTETDTPAPAASPAETGLLDPLNEREIQVLRLMAAGMSNREIASELFLSVNTIRWYASQLYSKLNVSRRGEAVARARELNLLTFT